MDDLIVPLALTGFQIDADQAVGEEVVARTMSAVLIRARVLDRQIDETFFLVHGDAGPYAGVAVERPRVFFPRIVAKLTWTRNRVERPDSLAGAHVECADYALTVVVRDDLRPFLERRSDDDDVLDDGGHRVEADFTRLQIDLLTGAEHDAFLQIEDAVPAERRDRLAGLRIELHHTEAGRDVHDPFVALAVGPVRDAAARELPRRDRRARALFKAVCPVQLAGLRVQRDDGAARAAGRVNRALDHQRRAFELVFRARTEIVGLEPPRHFEAIEVRCVDLVERRVLAAAEIRGVKGPLAILRARERRIGLSRDAWRDPCQRDAKRRQRQSDA